MYVLNKFQCLTTSNILLMSIICLHRDHLQDLESSCNQVGMSVIFLACVRLVRPKWNQEQINATAILELNVCRHVSANLAEIFGNWVDQLVRWINALLSTGLYMENTFPQTHMFLYLTVPILGMQVSAVDKSFQT